MIIVLRVHSFLFWVIYVLVLEKKRAFVVIIISVIASLLHLRFNFVVFQYMFVLISRKFYFFCKCFIVSVLL